MHNYQYVIFLGFLLFYTEASTSSLDPELKLCQHRNRVQQFLMSCVSRTIRDTKRASNVKSTTASPGRHEHNGGSVTKLQNNNRNAPPPNQRFQHQAKDKSTISSYNNKSSQGIIIGGPKNQLGSVSTGHKPSSGHNSTAVDVSVIDVPLTCEDGYRVTKCQDGLCCRKAWGR